MKRLLLLFALIVLIGKVIAAAHLPLFADEAFYWQCAQRLDIGFADHPPLTALLVRLGTELVGDSQLGVRIVFLLMGVAFPFVLYRLACPLVGSANAWMAAIFSLMLPGSAHLGLVAVPDVPILLLTVLFILGFEQATRTGSTRHWWVTGLAAGLGAATHYRFLLAPLSAFLYLILTRRGRERLGDRGLWLAAGLLLLGSVPAMAYNLRSDLGPLRFHLLTRHGPEPHPAALLAFLGEQAVLVTPLLFVVLSAVVAALVRKAWQGNDRAALMTCFALTPLGVFLAASPFETSGLATGHWPAPGYIPLLVYLPMTLRGYVARRPTRARKALAASAPATAAACVLTLLLDLATGWLQIGPLQKPFLGWKEVGEKIEATMLQDAARDGEREIVVADNYKLGANIEFQLRDRIDTYVLDHPKNEEHGRAPQVRSWNIGESALRKRADEDALIVVQVRELPGSLRVAWLGHVASFFDEIEPLDEVCAHAGSRHVCFRFYRGSRIAGDGDGVEWRP